MADFLMPALGADMETGRLVQWLVREGDRVRRGDVVAVVETHKGAIDVEVFLDGVIRELAPLGREMKVGALLARVGSDDEARLTAAVASAPEPMPAAKAVAEAGGSEQCRAPAIRAAATAGRPLASPAARRRASELGVTLEGLQGSGAGGVIVLADVECAAATRPAGPQIAALAKPIAAVVPEPVRRGFDPEQMRQAIAAAMGRSKREIPHYYLASQIDFHAAQAWLLDTTASSIPSSACCRLRCCSRRPRWRCASSPGSTASTRTARSGPGLASMSAGPSRCAAAAWSRPRSTTPTDSRCPS